MMLLALIAAIGVTAECKTGVRGDPVAIVRASGQSHYTYFLPTEQTQCAKYTRMFATGQLNRLCGCKHIKLNNYPEDVVRLRCIHRIKGRYLSRTVAEYFYYPEMIDNCNRLRDILMLGKKR